MLKFFRIIALLEGISCILLFFLAMPMKYMMGNDILIRPVGMAHGVLFVAYVLIAIMLKFEDNWSWKKFGIVFLGSLIPFGTFYVEKKVL